MPTLAAFFLLTGLASIGFPGTVGFVGAELLVEGAVNVYPQVGMLVVFAAALNGIAVVHAYFRLFTGTAHRASISLRARWPEKVAVLTLSVLIVGGGLWPQPGVTSRYHAATQIMARRHVVSPEHRHATVPPDRSLEAEAANPPTNSHQPSARNHSPAKTTSRARPAMRVVKRR
jgi:NADH-quinone oxidoreductase subunit M